MGIPVVDPRLMGSLPLDGFPWRLTRVPRTLITKANGVREEVYTATANPLYIDVPCRLTPFIMQRPTESEQTNPSEVTVSEFICMLKLYLPLFRNTDRVRIADKFGVTADYEVTGFESDGSSTYTRLKVKRLWV